MAIKFFTELTTRNTVAINSANVTYVREISNGGSAVYFCDGSNLKISDQFLEVVASLNTK